ncbi:hypothetical protein [Candidatus Galacturonibacter soehngenii]|uniref:Uncharacterized protein n=1 Tax=Candidatus Galacturonatibacter soehngenii TaxID=2307010 RepID=A0A7V7QKS0_9FIRM|nr:hypothetical protein [Candidatus Galacturonibacter soehngenii]KAB1438462.1 hypothetical protein F7O84_13035 [Candidatus Galacturonibacter soehngenii]
MQLKEVEKRKHQKYRVKKKNYLKLHMIPVLIATIIAVLAVFVGLTTLQQRLLAPKQWLFCEMDPIMALPFIFSIVLPFMWLFMWIALKIRRISETSKVDFQIGYSFVMKYKKWTALVWVICLYCSFTSVNFVTENTIIHYSPICPFGITYSYEDVDKVKAEFGSKRFTALEHQKLGNFSYSIYVDNKKLVFAVPNINQEIKRYKDSYLELEDFDTSLMRLGVIKESDDTYQDACDLDKQYVERFLRIINHK